MDISSLTIVDVYKAVNLLRRGAFLSFSEAVRSIRKMRGESMTAFAKHFLVSHAAISYWESGKSVPNWPTLVRLFSMARLDSQIEPILELLQDRFDLPEKPTPEQLEKAILDAGSTLEKIQTRAEHFPGSEKRAIAALELIQGVVEKGGPSRSLLVILRRLAAIDGRPEAERIMGEFASFLAYKIREFERHPPIVESAGLRATDILVDDDEDEEDPTPPQVKREIKPIRVWRPDPDDDPEVEWDPPLLGSDPKPRR